MLPSRLCAKRTMSTLPPVWLKSHVYQNVTAIVVKTAVTMKDGCKPPSSRKKSGTCQPVMSTARIMVVTSGERVVCSPGRANPRQPGSSPSGPSKGLTKRTANTTRKVVKELKASDGTPANGMFSIIVTRWTPSGKPKATANQIHPTRQRIIREPSSRSPARPWVRGITMRAAISGPLARKGIGQTPAAYKGQPTHEIA
jgi:hypothetical protein